MFSFDRISELMVAADKLLVEAVKRGEEAYSRMTAATQVKTASNNERIRFEADLAGFDKSEVSVKVDCDKLVIEAVKDTVSQLEFFGMGRVRHEVPLPRTAVVEKARAVYKNGVLQVSMPLDLTLAEVVEVTVE